MVDDMGKGMGGQGLGGMIGGEDGRVGEQQTDRRDR